MAYINSSIGSNDGSDSSLSSAALSVTAGNTIIVIMHRWGGSGLPNGVTDTAGNIYAKCGSDMSSGSDLVAYYIAHNITGHSANVVQATWDASVTYRRVIQLQYSGLHATAAHDTGYDPSPVTDNTSPLTTTSATTAVNNETIVGCFVDQDDINATFSSSSPSVYRISAGNDSGIADNVIATAGSGSVSIAVDQSHSYVCYAKAFKPAAGAELSASISCSASLSMNLSTGITLSGSASCAASCSADITTEIMFSAAGTCSASAYADLSTSILLNATAICQAFSTPSLETSITMASLMSCSSAVSATITTDSSMAALLGCSASVNALFSTSIIFFSQAACSATLTVDLSVGITLDALVSGGCSTVANLTTSIIMSTLCACTSALSAYLYTGQVVTIGEKRSFELDTGWRIHGLDTYRRVHSVDTERRTLHG
jgi:hypothetical protein